ncbi:MAG: DUF4342 domain-containing protein [Trueperaceae bacterium]|nr:DUF4342 domain-containing protein [Trueperaceae bacterium]
MNEPRPEGTPPTGERSVREEFRVSGEAVVAKVKELVREGNVRRISIKNDDGRTLLEIPLTIGVIGTVLLPVWAALGAMAALVANLTIAVERSEPRSPAEPAASPTDPAATPDLSPSAPASVDPAADPMEDRA